MELIHSTRNEIYKGDFRYCHKSKIVTAIFKYSNDESKEDLILNYLNERKPDLKIPKLHSVLENMTSPSDKEFKKLIIMEYIPSSKVFQYDGIKAVVDKPTRLEIAQSIGETVHQLHELDIYHRDIGFSNIICGPDGSWYLVDFGSACSEIDPQFKRTNFTANLAQDNFSILETAGKMNNEYPKDWKTTPSNKLL